MTWDPRKDGIPPLSKGPKGIEAEYTEAREMARLSGKLRNPYSFITSDEVKDIELLLQRADALRTAYQLRVSATPQ